MAMPPQGSTKNVPAMDANVGVDVDDGDNKYNKKKKSSPAGGGVSVFSQTAPPPTEAVVLILILLAGSLYFFPYCYEEIVREATPELFRERIFPDVISVEMLWLMRLSFGLFCASVVLYQINFKRIVVNPSYRPESKLERVAFSVSGTQWFYFFTSWGWILLMFQFFGSAYITYTTTTTSLSSVSSSQGQGVVPSWLLVGTLMAWKTSAPLTVLIGSVVTYVLWPATYKTNGPKHGMKTWTSLFQHNANIMMALTEKLLLGGLPVKMSHIVLPILFGMVYVTFSWSTLTHWRPDGRPATPYFFMDTTLGRIHTLSLLLLILVLLLFYALFCGMEYLVVHNNNLVVDTTGIVKNIVILLLLCVLTCRFRDPK